MTKFFLIRHGDTGVFGDEQTPQSRLTENGRRMVRDLSARIGGEEINRLLSSPYARAWESAKILGRALNLAPQKDERLIEIDLWEDPRQMEADSNRRLAQKQLEANQEAIGRFLEEERRRLGQTVAVVGHGNWIRAALGWALNLSANSMTRLTIGLGSLVILEYDEKGFWRLHLGF